MSEAKSGSDSRFPDFASLIRTTLLPDRQITELAVQPPLQKYFPFTPDPNHFTYLCRPVPHEGRLAIVTDAGRDAVDAEVPITNGADADGEDVWS
jgi:hypothetical protein